jgi:hypothetical protein
MLSPLAVGLLKGCGFDRCSGLPRDGTAFLKQIGSSGGEDTLLPQRQGAAGHATKRQ